MPDGKEIKISLEGRHLDILRRTFPEQPEDKAARALAEMMLDELLSLFDGTKRYMSLSHQYIDWLERIYATLLPKEEFRESRFLNLFRFPPGSATYMARVLRSRQNTAIHDEAIRELGQTLWTSYTECKGKVPEGAALKTVKITIRAYGIYGDLIDSIIRSDRSSPVEQPETSTRGHEFVQCSVNLRDVHLVLAEFKKQFPEASQELKIQAVKPLN